jgi:SAM-dependent methyltransferase
MKPRLLALLACPACGSGLDLQQTEVAPGSGEVVSGTLRCAPCATGYPILRGIPRLLPQEISRDKQDTARAFGYEWLHFVELHPEYEEQFLDWIHPLQPGYFPGKVVLDAGCGIGRHAYHAARYGASEVVAMDLSDAVETAYANLRDLPNAHVIQADIYHPPFRRGELGGPFDFIYSIGVLHHLPDPRAGFESLLRFVRPGGELFGWVYGHENNGVVHHVINPVRTAITSRLPAPVVSALSWPLAVVLQGVVKLVYRPLRGTAVFSRLPSAEYLLSLSAFGFRQNYSIVFDHLVAPTACYIKRQEFERWFTENGLQEVEITWRNQNSWRGRGRVGGATAAAGLTSAGHASPKGPPAR